MSDVLKIRKNSKSLKAVVNLSPSEKREESEDEEQMLRRQLENYYNKGYKEGYEKARSELEREFTDELVEKSEKFYGILSSFENKLIEYETSFNTIILEVSKKLAGKILRREIADRSSIEDVLKDSANKILGANEVIIKINPEDYNFLADEGKTEQFEQAFSRIKFEQTKSVDKGGCIIETEIGNVDGRITAQINEVVKSVEQKLFDE